MAVVTNDFHGPRALAVFRTIYPHLDFVLASESTSQPFNRWQEQLRRRERAAALYYLLLYQISSF